VDLAEELESCSLGGQRTINTLRRYPRVANNVTKQLSAWDELRGMLMAEGNKLGLVHLECAQLFSLDDAGFILTLEGLNAYLDGPVGKKTSVAFAPGLFFDYTGLLYENTRVAFNEHRSEEGMSFLSNLDIEIL